MFGRLLRVGKSGKEKEESDPSSSDASEATPLIIFDWDDTICPTWWINKVLGPSLADIKLEGPSAPTNPALIAVARAQQDMVAPKSRFGKVIQAHARSAEVALRAAKAVADVDIVTLGTPDWFALTASYFPGVDIPALLKELDIRVYYAVIPEHVRDSADPRTVAKQTAMAECIVKRYGIGVVRWSVLGIGDQPEEHEALKACCRECPHRKKKPPICKTLMLHKEPLVEDLTADLERLAKHFGRLATHASDGDWTSDTVGRT